MKKVLPILIALLLAAFASFGILQWAKKQQTGGATVSYVSAVRTIEPGTTLTDKELSEGYLPYPVFQPQDGPVWKSVFQDFVKPENQKVLVGRVVKQEIQAGFPILESSLKPVEIKSEGVDWKTKISEGKRAIAIPVGGTNAVNGLIQVGDHVDVLVTVKVPIKDDAKTNVNLPVRMGDAMQNITVPTGSNVRGEPMSFYLLQDVEILSIGEKTFMNEEIDKSDPLAALAEKSGAGSNGITVALAPEKVLELAFINAAGESSFYIALRQPGDVGLYDTANKPPADFKSLLKSINAPQ